MKRIPISKISASELWRQHNIEPAEKATKTAYYGLELEEEIQRRLTEHEQMKKEETERLETTLYENGR